MNRNCWAALAILSMSGITVVNAECTVVPPEVNNATTAAVNDSAPFAEGTVFQYRCPNGYNIEGSMVLTTCTGGQWTAPSFQCILIQCPLFGPPEHGSIVGNPSYNAGSSMTFACNEGFDTVGQVTVNCRVDGMWSPETLPTCTAKDCGAFPGVQNGQTFQPSSEHGDNRYGSEIRITCNDNYILNGNVKVTCQADGTWSTPPTCNEITCPPYPGLESSCISQTYYGLNTLYITCLDGPEDSVTEVGGVSTECTSNGWRDLTVACYCDCKIQANGTNVQGLNAKGFLPHGQEMAWSCDDNYQYIEKKVKCLDGNLILIDTGEMVNQTSLCVPVPTTTLPSTTSSAKPTLPSSIPPSAATTKTTVALTTLLSTSSSSIVSTLQTFSKSSTSSVISTTAATTSTTTSSPLLSQTLEAVTHSSVKPSQSKEAPHSPDTTKVFSNSKSIVINAGNVVCRPIPCYFAHILIFWLCVFLSAC